MGAQMRCICVNASCVSTGTGVVKLKIDVYLHVKTARGWFHTKKDSCNIISALPSIIELRYERKISST